MSETAGAQRFSCEACNRSYAWKQELAGRRVKCKCGHVMVVPKSMRAQEEEELYDLAPAEEDAGVSFSKLRAATTVSAAASSAPRGGGVRVAQPVPGAATAAPAGLGYQTGLTERDRERMSSKTLVDMNRDVYVPSALLILGFAICVGYYAWSLELGGGAIAAVTFGLSIITLFKAALLIGFALVVAGPLGVSFGGVFSAILKLAAVAVFCDGITTWVEAGVDKMTGTGGGLGIMISFPVALGVYWLLLIYLFSMDAGDSWLVVILLAVFDMIVRWVLLMLLLAVVLNWGGVSSSAAAAFGGASAAESSADPDVARVAELKQTKQLEEARQFIEGGRQLVFKKPVDAWYAAGCKNVWFEISRDFNGKPTPVEVIVELPKDKDKRAKCFQTLKEYYDEHDLPYDEEEVTDGGERYIFVYVR